MLYTLSFSSDISSSLRFSTRETTLSSMVPGFPPEQLSLPHNLLHDSSDAGQDYSQSFPHYPYGNQNASGYLTTQQSVPSTPNNQSQLNPQPFPSDDLSHIHDQGHLEIDNSHVAPIQEHCVTGMGGTNLQIVHGEIMDHLGLQRASCSSDPLGSSSVMTVHNLFSPLTELYSQSGVQDDYINATSFLRGQVEGAAQNHLVVQEHSTTTQEACRRRAIEQRVQEKRRQDKERKHKYRVDGKQAYTRICELLEIDFMPENNRAQRILEVVEGLVGQLEVVNDLRRQLEETEEYVDTLKRLDTNAPTGAYIGYSLPPHQGPSYAG